jgi:hypothetical protein
MISPFDCVAAQDMGTAAVRCKSAAQAGLILAGQRAKSCRMSNFPTMSLNPHV